MVANPTMEPIAIIRKHLEDAEPDLLRDLLQGVVEALMGAEVDALAGAAYRERSEARTNRRNGYRSRRWDTRAGTIDLAIPKLRQGAYFPAWLLEPRRRAERALLSVVTQAYVEGVSTRRVEDLVQTLGVKNISKSQVSEIAAALDAEVESFRRRPLDGGPYRLVSLDALALKVREEGRIVSAAALIAIGVNREGHREILGLDVVTAEDGTAWTSFLRDLVARGLSGVVLVTSDAHEGPKSAIAAVLPGAAWQRCRTHFARNLLAKVPRSAQDFVAAMCRSISLRPTATRCGPSTAASATSCARSLPAGRGAARQRARGSPRLHQLPARSLAPDLVDQPAGAPEPRAATPQRRRRHLPQPRCDRAAHRRGARRATR
jgi:putative transposase